MTIDAVIDAVSRLRRAIRETREPTTRSSLRELEVELRRHIGPSITKAQAARALATTPAALDRWIERGFLPIVVSEGRTRAGLETEPVLELAERAAQVRSRGYRRPLARATRELGWLADPDGRRIIHATVAALPRPNVSVAELRRDYRASTPEERVRRTAELSRAATAVGQAASSGR